MDAKCELTPPWSELGTHPHKVADRRLHRGHRHRQIRDGFPVHLSLLVHDDQVGDLLGHRLQDTLDGLGVEHRHRERLLPQPRQKKRRLVAPAEYPPLSPLLSSPLLSSSPLLGSRTNPELSVQLLGRNPHASLPPPCLWAPSPLVSTSVKAGLRRSVSSGGSDPNRDRRNHRPPPNHSEGIQLPSGLVLVRTDAPPPHTLTHSHTHTHTHTLQVRALPKLRHACQ